MIFYLNLRGDIEDLANVFGSPIVDAFHTKGHCSALLRLPKGNDDLFISQVWHLGPESLFKTC